MRLPLAEVVLIAGMFFTVVVGNMGILYAVNQVEHPKAHPWAAWRMATGNGFKLPIPQPDFTTPQVYEPAP